LKVCFVVSQIFAWGKYGGFGSLTRTIGSELVKRGIEVFAVVPRYKGQRPVEELDGITILSFSPSFTLFSKKIYKACDADIYHSEEPTIGTYIAMKAMPNRKHIITSQDPRDKNDWIVEYSYYPLHKKISTYLYETNYLVNKSVKNADAVFCQAKYIIPKVKSLYGLTKDPDFLPNPVDVPIKSFKKADEPTVCFLARWDKRKKPEIFFNLAKKFPDINFIAMGKAHDEKWDKYLREKYTDIPNLEMPGFVSSEQKKEILEKSWIMVNTATRECLPVSYLEASAHKCAILGSENPDDFAENFGYHVKNDDYVSGLKFLLDNRWRERGAIGYEYVKETHELNKVIDKHISIYEKLTGGG
jgi:glycosyltransferase involved in cell wall biosynthesis